MITDEARERVAGWFAGRLPAEWQAAPADITIDREEITVRLTIPDVELAGDASEVTRAEARAGRAKAFREETRAKRMEIAREAEHRYDAKVSWGVSVGEGEDQHGELWTHVAAPVMTRLRQPQRLVLDTLVDAGVARSRADALAWCVRLVGQHEDDWLTELRDAMASVADVRSKGPAARGSGRLDAVEDGVDVVGVGAGVLREEPEAVGRADGVGLDGVVVVAQVPARGVPDRHL